jgi:hypothetical protein
VWHFVIGLVGKPSAGKSTFYNAATRAVLRGRKMAEVAPHPFTTIEPNIGPGWYCGPTDNDAQGRATAHGRDWLGTGRRLMPVIIKDVAGLVPGAYKGRGKVMHGASEQRHPCRPLFLTEFFLISQGNKFLNDLTDVDVLIHVVDATGRADRDGNMLGAGETGYVSAWLWQVPAATFSFSFWSPPWVQVHAGGGRAMDPRGAAPVDLRQRALQVAECVPQTHGQDGQERRAAESPLQRVQRHVTQLPGARSRDPAGAAGPGEESRMDVVGSAQIGGALPRHPVPGVPGAEQNRRF